MDKVFTILAAVPLLMGMAVAVHMIVGLVIALPVMWCFNGFGPSLFSFAEMTYWQAYALYLFSVCLGAGAFSANSSSND